MTQAWKDRQAGLVGSPQTLTGDVFNRPGEHPFTATLGAPRSAKDAPHGALSSKEHAQRIAAAKARWLHEGHHDVDTEFDAKRAHAEKAWLGRANKVAAVEQQRHGFWQAVGDTQQAYDKVRTHLHPAANLMMEVPHQRGLLYNPEGVGLEHFDHRGRPKQDLYSLHPAEVDDWIKHHGKHAETVGKRAPPGLIVDQRDLAIAAASASHGFQRLAVPA